MNKTTHKLIYFIFALVLIVPFFLRKISGQLEPFPAIILPSGANTVSISDSLIKYQETKILAENKNGNKYEEMNSKFFSEDLPQFYFLRVAENNFGLNEVPDTISENDRIFGKIEFVRPRYSSDEDIAFTKEWLRKKLKANNMKDSLLVIRQSEVTYNRLSKKEKEREITKETAIVLYW